ncbi:MAG: hypothetical protein H0Z35_12385 [Thermoanaerobacteraceae bacterium]|nr:hypothetical protein [Thermoanaerobacteraceae bacterium]
MKKLKFIGQTAREIPSQGIFKPGWEGEVENDEAKILLSTGLFEEVKETKKKGADK